MPKVNTHFQDLSKTYIFSTIEQKLEHLKKDASHDLPILNLGIGDVAKPLAPSIASVISQAAFEMSKEAGMRGYGPSSGYPFLKQAIVASRYSHLGISPEEIFISDGINSDILNLLDLFSLHNTIAIPNPSYPAYKDACVINGRLPHLTYLPCSAETDFLPYPPQQACDLIFLCSPHNPTGVAFTRSALSLWVEYAKKHDAIILYDSAYTAFVTSHDVPLSIFEIEGAHEVAIECCSFSKSAGFTGLRCAYAVVPRTLRAPVSLHALWSRRQAIKFNGVAYPIQMGALATLMSPGKEETWRQVQDYGTCASLLRSGLLHLGFTCFGGMDSPYIWWKTPDQLSSWEFFDLLLEKGGILSIPGEGFGEYGKGYVRLSAFTSQEIVKETLSRLASL